MLNCSPRHIMISPSHEDQLDMKVMQLVVSMSRPSPIDLLYLDLLYLDLAPVQVVSKVGGGGEERGSFTITWNNILLP